jgi:flagellar assembly protein FliH
MINTSKILQAREQAAVTPILWRDTNPGTASKRSEKPEPKKQDQPSGANVERIEREAYQRGFAEGQATGKDQAGSAVSPVVERLSRSLAELGSLRSRIRRDAEGDLLKLSIAIARRVLHRELTLDPESIEGLIKVALDKLQSRESCRVRVHPEQEEAIRVALERAAHSSKMEIIPDPSLQSGDVLFETAHGTIDASIETQLREIERGFADRLQR